jgi:hypothetical protein
MLGDWRDYRPGIWLTMAGIAAALLLNSVVYAAPFLGAAIGVSIRVWQRRRRLAKAPPPRKRPREPPRKHRR